MLPSARRLRTTIGSKIDPMRLSIAHSTTYQYAEPLGYGLLQVRLTPKSRAGQRVLNWKITIDGGSVQAEFDDHHNNLVALVSTDSSQTELAIHCEGEVVAENRSGLIGEHGGNAPLWLFRRTTPLTRSGKLVRALARDVDPEMNDEVARLHALSNAVANAIVYQIGQTDAATTAEEALEAGRGVCQDHAHTFVSAARLLGYPARYVGGYLMMNDRIDQDAGHAWAEAYVNNLGWIGFDISNQISPDDRYVRVATGLDYRDAAPVSGLTYGNKAESMAVSLQVQQ